MSCPYHKKADGGTAAKPAEKEEEAGASSSSSTASSTEAAAGSETKVVRRCPYSGAVLGDDDSTGGGGGDKKAAADEKQQPAAAEEKAAAAPQKKCPYASKAAGDADAEAEAGATTTASGEPKKCPYASSSSSSSSSAAPPSSSSSSSKKAEASAVLAASEAAAVAAAGAGVAGAGSVSSGFSAEASAALKGHFTAAYNQVATVGGEEGGLSPERVAENVRVAKVLTERLGYSKAQVEVVGDDVWKMQGTGNPHTLAALHTGERVVDLGSGFGIDAFLAASVVGETGHVVGVDLAEGEVFAAIRRAQERGLRSVDFRLGDIENVPVASGAMDCAISNGGFCLVPNKRAAFAEIFRVLRPGGRMSVSCTASRKPLDPSVKWPTCMLVFMPLWEAREILESVGFVDIEIHEQDDDVWKKKSDAKKDADAVLDKGGHGTAAQPEEKKERVFDADAGSSKANPATTDKAGRVTVHRGDSAYSHLKSMDMDYLFPRVNVFARKP